MLSFVYPTTCEIHVHVMRRTLQLFVELFCFIGEQIGFKVLVFSPAGPDIGPGLCTFLSIIYFWFSELSLSS